MHEDFSSFPFWKKISLHPHHHGIAIPLFSLRSSKSCGIGEFSDLFLLIDWLKMVGMDTLQLLPLNDSGRDPSPYSAISSCALNPLFISLTSLPFVSETPSLLKKLPFFEPLNHLPRIDYAEVNRGKEDFLKEYFHLFFPLYSKKEEWELFKQENPWLEAYSLFKTLKILSDWQSIDLWPDERKKPTLKQYAALLKDFETEINYHSFLQFLAMEQLKKVKRYATSQGIFLKGDIPILISKESADVWHHPEYFFTDKSAGAPPDMYSLNGQNWGFPLYNWKKMEEEGDVFWRTRLQVAERFYHLYRLDHIVGFYRIWSIPAQKNAKNGSFFPEDPGSWISHGEAILKRLLTYSSMLPIGEDLGTVPPEVRQSLTRLKIPGTKIMRWERYWEGDKSYIPIENYPFLSMTSVGTHDSEVLKRWWTAYIEDAKMLTKQKQWKFTYEMRPENLFEILWDSHHTESLFHINPLSEYLALVPGMTWHDIEDERINTPGVVSNKNWTYRLRPSLEVICTSLELKNIIEQAINLPSAKDFKR